MKNWAKCGKCGDIVESKYRHDFQACRCGEIFVDGGHDYFRAGYNDPKNFIRLDEHGQPIEEGR